jgi:hypothetical protein
MTSIAGDGAGGLTTLTPAGRPEESGRGTYEYVPPRNYLMGRFAAFELTPPVVNTTG